jgi:hypothetical protein
MNWPDVAADQEFANGKKNFRRFILAKSCGKNFSFRSS